MSDFLSYKYMITPGILKILSYVGMVVALIVGLLGIMVDPVAGISTAVLGPIVIRIYAELMLVIFEINENLKKIADTK